MTTPYADSEDKLPQPENMRRMNAPDAASWHKGLCGDTMEMYLVIDGGIITEASFFTDGCSASRLCGSAAALLVRGTSVSEALAISPASVSDKVGRLSPEETHCAILAAITLHKALADHLLHIQMG